MNEHAAHDRTSGFTDDELFAVVGGGPGAAGGETSPAAALAELFDRYHARVHIWCARVLGDAAAADDATQDIFLGLLSRPTAYAGRTRFAEWLYVVTRNHCLNLNRRRRRQVRIDGEGWLEETLTARDDPAASAAEDDASRLVRDICAEVLSPLEQQVVHLRYHWQLRVKEITVQLELPNTSGARSQLATATRKIRRALVRRLGEDGARSLFWED